MPVAYAPCFLAIFAPITEATRHTIVLSTTRALTLLGRTLALTRIVRAALRSPFGLGYSTCFGAKVFSLGTKIHPS